MGIFGTRSGRQAGHECGNSAANAHGEAHVRIAKSCPEIHSQFERTELGTHASPPARTPKVGCRKLWRTSTNIANALLTPEVSESQQHDRSPWHGRWASRPEVPQNATPRKTPARLPSMALTSMDGGYRQAQGHRPRKVPGAGPADSRITMCVPRQEVLRFLGGCSASPYGGAVPSSSVGLCNGGQGPETTSKGERGLSSYPDD